MKISKAISFALEMSVVVFRQNSSEKRISMPCFEAMNIGVAISQTWDLMISWSDN